MNTLVGLDRSRILDCVGHSRNRREAWLHARALDGCAGERIAEHLAGWLARRSNLSRNWRSHEAD
jgi:hypothetical protein